MEPTRTARTWGDGSERAGEVDLRTNDRSDFKMFNSGESSLPVRSMRRGQNVDPWRSIINVSRKTKEDTWKTISVLSPGEVNSIPLGPGSTERNTLPPHTIWNHDSTGNKNRFLIRKLSQTKPLRQSIHWGNGIVQSKTNINSKGDK